MEYPRLSGIKLVNWMIARASRLCQSEERLYTLPFPSPCLRSYTKGNTDADLRKGLYGQEWAHGTQHSGRSRATRQPDATAGARATPHTTPLEPAARSDPSCWLAIHSAERYTRVSGRKRSPRACAKLEAASLYRPPRRSHCACR